MEHLAGIIVPTSLFAMIAVIVGAFVWGGVQQRREANETLRRALETGHQLTADQMAALQKPTATAAQDLRGGIILCAMAIGFALAGALFGGATSVERVHNGFSIEAGSNGYYIVALIVGAVGVGRLLAAYVRRERPKP
jgi:hypothetical protein